MKRLNQIRDTLRAGTERFVSSAQTLLGHSLAGLSSMRDRVMERLNGLRAGGTGVAAPQTATQAMPAEPVRTADDQPPLDEGERVYAIGDIHGRADLLARLLDRIDGDAAGFGGSTTLVFLGDYIDRGFQSRQVLDLLLSDRVSSYDRVFLKGNHEEAMLRFLSDHSFGPKWSSYGGRETLVSYGIQPPRNVTRAEDWIEARDALLHAMPREHERFLLQLQTSAQIGGYGFVHAGIRPGVAFADQSEQDLLWIREAFLNDTDLADVIVVHGHTPTSQPFRDHRRINVDTGAYFTGRLTAVRLEADRVEFLSTDT